MYKTVGPVRGGCGHRHRSLKTATECLKKDQRACASLGGGAYSDRCVVHLDGTGLSEDEYDQFIAFKRGA
jgi:hypothetical protein